MMAFYAIYLSCSVRGQNKHPVCGAPSIITEKIFGRQKACHVSTVRYKRMHKYFNGEALYRMSTWMTAQEIKGNLLI
jgi:hypothetical protein